jgi:hypothetical protein
MSVPTSSGIIALFTDILRNWKNSHFSVFGHSSFQVHPCIYCPGENYFDIIELDVCIDDLVTNLSFD